MTHSTADLENGLALQMHILGVYEAHAREHAEREEDMPEWLYAPYVAQLRTVARIQARLAAESGDETRICNLPPASFRLRPELANLVDRAVSALSPDTHCWLINVGGPLALPVVLDAAHRAMDEGWFDHGLFVRVGEHDAQGDLIATLPFDGIFDEIGMLLPDAQAQTGRRKPESVLRAMAGRRVVIVCDGFHALQPVEQTRVVGALAGLPEGCRLMLTGDTLESWPHVQGVQALFTTYGVEAQ